MGYSPARVGAIALALLMMGGAARGDELTIGVGAAYVPESEGADEYRFAPLPSIEWRTSWGGVSTSRLGVEADFIASRGFSAGPILRYDGGRNDLSDIDDPVVRLLAPVDGALEVGGYAGFVAPLIGARAAPSLALTGRIEAMVGLDGGHEGAYADASIGVIGFADPWTLGAAVTVSYADATYMDAYFGVTPADSIASGLAVYAPGGGLRSGGFTAFASYALSETWNVAAIGGYRRMLGDAADSPIVAVAGDEDQAIFGLALRYRVF